MNLEDLMVSETNQMEKDKYLMIPLIFGESSKQNKNRKPSS